MDGESESISAPNNVSATKALIAEGFDESQAAMMGEQVILVDENDINVAVNALHAKFELDKE